MGRGFRPSSQTRDHRLRSGLGKQKISDRGWARWIRNDDAQVGTADTHGGDLARTVVAIDVGRR